MRHAPTPTRSASARGVPGNPLSSSRAWVDTASGTRSVAFPPRFHTAAKGNGPKSTPAARGPGSAHSSSSSTSTAIPPRRRGTSRTSTGKSLIDSISRWTSARLSHFLAALELPLNEHQGVPLRRYDLLSRGRRPSVGLSQLGLGAACARLPGDLAGACRPTYTRPGSADIYRCPEESSTPLRPRRGSIAVFRDPGAAVP